MEPEEQSVESFLKLIKQSRRGKFKVYIGMSAGVGKTYRMLQEAHSLKNNGVNVQIGYIETHNRKETQELVDGLPAISRRTLFYKGKELEEMDLEAILNIAPEVVLVDELAHSNINGSKNEKRWQDVIEILNAGISVISAINIQHIESLNPEVERITGITITERIPDRILQLADEVVNIDLTVDELLDRLKAGKIYQQAKINTALSNFFQFDKIIQLRELALREVAHQLERKINTEVPKNCKLRTELFLACIGTNEISAKNIIRKTARLASYYNSAFAVLYVQTDRESADNIKLSKQRFLINNFKLAKELGAEVIRIKNNNVGEAIYQTALQREVTTICLGKPHFSLLQMMLNTSIFDQLLKRMGESEIDLVILS